MSNDTKELELTSDVRNSIAKNLGPAAQHLYAGHSVDVVVPNNDTGRALVEGDEAILKQLCDQMLKSWGQGTLKAGEVKFIVGDFTKFEDPRKIVEGILSQLPKIKDLGGIEYGKKFSDFYPGTIIGLVGVDRIPHTADVDGLNIIAKYSPSVFIHRPITDYGSLNRSVFSAMGAYGSGSFQAIISK